MKQKRYILTIVGFILVILVAYACFNSSSYSNTIPLTSPNINHWFGTDINGKDMFLRSMIALGYELLILSSVLLIIWVSGLIIGGLTSFFKLKLLRIFFLNLIHYIATLPILLVALFLLIIIGAGLINSIVILILAIIPTHSLYVYNQFESAKNESFIVANKGYGLSDFAIYKSHLFPFIVKRYNSYTLSRIPEIIMLNIALNFLGLGIKEPNPSLGRLLFDGISFMFSEWHLWVFPVLSIVVLFYLLKLIFNESFSGYKRYY
ncbi:MAG: ABC transporter permease subunit [Bacteroidetes bacterium]|nr:ABC transporter permease subunit [Bacteroidota bacterium]